MELIETCFRTSVVIYHISATPGESSLPRISPFLMVSEVVPMQNTVCK